MIKSSKATLGKLIIAADTLIPKNLFESHYDRYLYPAYRQALLKL